MIELPESRIKSWFNNRRAKLRKSINSVDSSNSDEGVHEEVTGDDSSSVSDNNGNTKLPVDEEKEDTKDVVDNHIDGGEFYENISLERDNDCLKISEENERVRIDSEDRKTVKVTEGIPASYVEDVFPKLMRQGMMLTLIWMLNGRRSWRENVKESPEETLLVLTIFKMFRV